MNKINYNLEMQNLIDKTEGKKRLLLHACCAPCSSACIERLKDKFDITVFFYNPNMDSREEYEKRATEQIRLCNEFNVSYHIEQYNRSDFYGAVKGMESEREGGIRCFACYRLRLEKTAAYAKQNNFDYFATTLTLSPLKNSQKLNEIGYDLQRELEVKYLPSDFKKQGGYLRSIALSKEYNLYRQSYCGCEYSKNK